MTSGWSGHGRTVMTGPSADDGMVTAEMVVVLPALLLVLVAGLAAVSAVTTQLRCADAAQVAARMAARGESPSVATAAAHALTPAGSDVRVEDAASSSVVVRVSSPVRLPGLGQWLPTFTVTESFTEPREPAGVDSAEAG